PRFVDVGEQDAIDLGGRRELACRTSADGAEADDPDAHQVSSSAESSCQPPRCGGVPPVPRSRSTAAIAAATPSATSARRINVILGLLFGRELFSGASWSRTSDLTLIRGA